MNHNEEVPDYLGVRGDMLPADVLKKVNELLEQLHRKDKDHQGSPVFIYAPGSQYVDKQFVFGDKGLGKQTEGTTDPAPPDGHPSPNRGGELLPEVLRTDEAMALWRKVQRAGYVDEHYQPLLSRTQAALLADAMAERLGIKEKWKVFESFWQRKNMYKDFYNVFNQKQSLVFQDSLKTVLR
jgi:hypothetical protein